jgi:transcriptional regulator with XRE-family HTH domain
MNVKEIIKEAMASCKWTQKELAMRLGYASQSGIGNIFTRNNKMSIDRFVKIMKEMGYEVEIHSTSPTLNKNKWVLTCDEEEK